MYPHWDGCRRSKHTYIHRMKIRWCMMVRCWEVGRMAEMMAVCGENAWWVMRDAWCVSVSEWAWASVNESVRTSCSWSRACCSCSSLALSLAARARHRSASSLARLTKEWRSRSRSWRHQPEDDRICTIHHTHALSLYHLIPCRAYLLYLPRVSSLCMCVSVRLKNFNKFIYTCQDLLPNPKHIKFRTLP